ncbi:MAG: hypothetical protein M5U34_27760 [Chloroflexi bacterium]|nr:hypothetical protein [Chloroflexota bacterium]
MFCPWTSTQGADACKASYNWRCAAVRGNIEETTYYRQLRSLFQQPGNGANIPAGGGVIRQELGIFVNAQHE